MLKNIRIIALFSIFALVLAPMTVAQGQRAVAPATSKAAVKLQPVEIKQEMMKNKTELIEAREAEVETIVENDETFQAMRQEKMSEVAKQVEIFLAEKEEGEGIGTKVREVAREQKQAQERIEERLEQMEQRKTFVKRIIGYHQEAVGSIKEEIAANRSRAEELLTLQETSKDPAEYAEIEAAIVALTEQNVYLQESVRQEMQNQGIFGWFRGFFKRN